MMLLRCPVHGQKVPVIRELNPWPPVDGRGVWRLARHRVSARGYAQKVYCGGSLMPLTVVRTWPGADAENGPVGASFEDAREAPR
jgi:hypothetical protein